MSKAKYCKCKNTYTINNCDEANCSAFYYWYQGIGSLTTEVVTNNLKLEDDTDFLLEDGTFFLLED
jgi:hypothetical protein